MSLRVALPACILTCITVKYVPEWFPGASFRKFGSAAARRINAVCQLPYDKVKERKVRCTYSGAHVHHLMHIWQAREGNAGLSVTATFLEMPGLTPEKEHMCRWASEAVYAAGSDTTVSSIYTFMMCMARNIDVQKKAQAELDNVIGSSRLPDMDDYDSLPYIRAVALESMRWMPVAPLGIPHMVITDDEYQGYKIPKGSVVIPVGSLLLLER